MVQVCDDLPEPATVSELPDAPQAGRLRVTRGLPPSHLGPRWLALDEIDSTSHVVHRPTLRRDRFEQRRFLAELAPLQAFRHPHVLQIQQVGVDPVGTPYLVTPFTGHREGLLTLERHCRLKGGYLEADEALRAMEQLLDAVHAAHAAGLSHGRLDAHHVLVSLTGSLTIELYGIARQLGIGPARRHAEADAPPPELRGEDPHTPLARAMTAEVRSLVSLGYRLVTGLVPDRPLIRASRVVHGLPPVWDDWFDTGLNGPGFRSAAHARSALLDSPAPRPERVSVVRSVIRQIIGS